MRNTLISATLVVFLLTAPHAAPAQSLLDPQQTAARAVLLHAAPDRPEALTDESAGFLPLPRFGPWVGYAKWGSLTAAAGLATLGFLWKEDANRKFDRLTRRCERAQDLCRQRNRDGSYADPNLERLFQDVRSLDHRAQASLIAAQVSFGASVVFFVLDWQRGEGPGNIPYDPEREEERSRVRLTVVPGSIALRYYPN